MKKVHSWKHGTYQRRDQTTMKVALITSYGPAQEKIAEISIPLMSTMCKRQNLIFYKIFDKEPTKDRFISKIQAIKSIIKDFDWVMWCDIDIIPRNCKEYSLREVLNEMEIDRQGFLTHNCIGSQFALRSDNNTVNTFLNKHYIPVVDEIKIMSELANDPRFCKYDDRLQTYKLWEERMHWCYHAFMAPDGRWPITIEQKIELLTMNRDLIIWE